MVCKHYLSTYGSKAASYEVRSTTGEMWIISLMLVFYFYQENITAMKTLIQFSKFFCLFCGVSILACEHDPEADPGTEPSAHADTLTVADLDSFSDRLQFFGATKTFGKSPAAPNGASLKISIKDTLYLLQGIHLPIRFLHENITDNVAGAYFQVVSKSRGGILATNFYEVAELTETAENDTVSVIMVGFDPPVIGNSSGVPPAGTPADIVDITITPYNEIGQPLDEITVPVSVQELNDDPTNANGSGECSLVNGSGDQWNWDMSFIQYTPQDTIKDPKSNFFFYSDPTKVFGANGQNIKGCCTDGVSSYDIICASNTTTQRSLRFHTFYQIQAENFTFFDNGSYLRQTFEKSAIPAPDESDFCGGGPGVVKQRINHAVTNGNWTMDKMDVSQYFKEASFDAPWTYLTLRGTSSTGGGFGNPGGVVYQLTCNFLVLIQPDLEGFEHHLYKFYQRYSIEDQEYWHAM